MKSLRKHHIYIDSVLATTYMLVIHVLNCEQSYFSATLSTRYANQRIPVNHDADHVAKSSKKKKTYRGDTLFDRK